MTDITKYLENAIDGGVQEQALKEFSKYCSQIIDLPDALEKLPTLAKIEIGNFLIDSQRAHSIANSLDYYVHQAIKKHTGLSTWDFSFPDHG